MTVQLERAEYERRYLSQLRSLMELGLSTNGTDKYEVYGEQVGFHEEETHSWAYVTFRVASMPGCVFARAEAIWCGHANDEDPAWMAQLFDVHLYETLEARGWGLPPTCEPERGTWLHPYGIPPWEQPPAVEEPERRAWEKRFLRRVGELLDTMRLDGVTPAGVELRDERGETHALLTVRVAGGSGHAFTHRGRVWVGWPTPMSAEARAENFHERLEKRLEHLPGHQQPEA